MKAIRVLALGLLALGLGVIGAPRQSAATDWCSGRVCQEWVARYAGPETSGDWASAIAVDGAGNVYVTGSSWNGSSYDYTTVKYDPAGTEAWVAQYDGPIGGQDRPLAMAVDGAGNVYVTGYSASARAEDYATVKYDAAGNQLWAARYNGPGDWHDYARAIAVDGDGNVYVTGWSYGSATSAEDYATIKYDAMGNEVWVARYDSGLDAAFALALDGAGNVYVTGYTWPADGTSDYDYGTVKYDAGGNQLWAARYNGAGNSRDIPWAIATDRGGSVYVTGESVGSGTGSDYATIKYDPPNNEAWVARYDGPANSSDIARATAVDSAGNVYVTGRSAGLGSSDDYATVKYAEDGSELWTARYNGPGNGIDWASAVAVDAAGRVYATGLSVGSASGEDYATVSYDAGGNQLWAARYDGPDSSQDDASAVAVDGVGIVYVTGLSTGTARRP